jgi:hypothetical protein
MADATTFEEAKRCPRCGHPGEEIKAARSMQPRDGGKLYTIFCRWEGCEWENTGWAVQVDRNNELVTRARGEKTFPTLSNDQLSAGMRMIEDIKQQDLRGRE